MLLLALGCTGGPYDVPPSTTGAGFPFPGGAEIWLAGGTTGLPPISLTADGDGMCGVEGGVAELDGDGVPDIALLCQGDSRRSGVPTTTTDTEGNRYHVVVWSGAAALLGETTPIGLSPSVPADHGFAAVPDLDGDGLDELSVGVEYDPSGAHAQWAQLVAGGSLPAGGDVRWGLEGDFLWYPATPTGTAAGDYDLDGVPDLVVAGWPSSSADDNRVYVVSGATVPAGGRVDDAPLRLWTLPSADGRLARVSPVGDLDGDDLPDLVAALEGDGTLIVLLGASDGAMASAPRLSTMDLGRDGSVAVVGLGDLDGDGRDELAISAHRFDSSQDQETRVAVVPGADVPSALSFDPYVVEASADSLAGVVACDVDGDGAADLLTARGWTSGADLLTVRPLPSAPLPEGSRVAGGVCAGDLDGDGRSDVVVPTLYPTP